MNIVEIKIKNKIFYIYFLVDTKDHAIVEWINEKNCFSVAPLEDVFLNDPCDQYKIDEIYEV